MRRWDMRDVSGATPLDADEAHALLPTHIATQGELNAWEQRNIAAAARWAMSRRRRRTEHVLSVRFAQQLHRRMFDATWQWAGTYRVTDKSLDIPASQGRVALRDRLADVLLWHAERIFDRDELAARLHFVLVSVHPWPNGNGRWARLMADAYLHVERQPLFTWGSAEASTARNRYVSALKAADAGEFTELLRFVRT